eukprot:1105507-Pyramimonas_sp.AAC.1
MRTPWPTSSRTLSLSSAHCAIPASASSSRGAPPRHRRYPALAVFRVAIPSCAQQWSCDGLG